MLPPSWEAVMLILNFMNIVMLDCESMSYVAKLGGNTSDVNPHATRDL